MPAAGRRPAYASYTTPIIDRSISGRRRPAGEAALNCAVQQRVGDGVAIATATT